MSSVWDLVTLGFFVAGAIAALVLAAWIYPRSATVGPAGKPMVTALAVMAVWALAVPALGGESPSALAVLGLSNLAWTWTLYRLFANDQRHASLKPIRPVVLVLATLELLQIILVVAAARLANWPDAGTLIFRFAMTLRLLFCVGSLVLVHNLFVGASPAGRATLRWPAAAMGLMWLYDLNFYTVAYLFDAIPETLFDLRGLIIAAMTGLLALGSTQPGARLAFRPSRSVTFQSISLLLIGGYLVAMVLVAQGMSYAGGEFSRLLQLAFVVAASSLALIMLPSRKMRGWFRVKLAKHLFQHRYDYRVEWLRFTETVSGEGNRPLAERAIQAVADITDSPCGLLLTPDETGVFQLDAEWQWPQAPVPANALPATLKPLLAGEHYIVDLDLVRARIDDKLAPEQMPAWLRDEQQAWALVPLIHRQRLIGVVVLGRSFVPRKLDWEDFDLLRVAGQQLASYLAEQAGHEALVEAHRFDEFNRRIAFVMHDIKNLASQLSLLTRNAERHADNPEFRADMLVTLRNSSDKLNTLLARLGRYGAHGSDRPGPLRLDQLAAEVVSGFTGPQRVQLLEHEPCTVLANREALEQALVHLIQNAIDASEPDSPVFVNVLVNGVQAEVEVVDTGCGMSQEFIRTRLFKPFHSSKRGGFGIGAFEARELVRAMGGRIDVESREGLGTRFHVRLPVAEVAMIYDRLKPAGEAGANEVA